MFVQVGSALAEVRESGLYRERFDSFAEYCRVRWGMGRRRAYQLIDASAVVLTMVNTEPPTDLPFSVPANERQARPLAALPREEQLSAWTEAVETAPNGKVTAAHVEAVVEKRLAAAAPIPYPAPPAAPAPAPLVPAEFADYVEEEVDAIAEWERAEKEIEELRALVERLQTDDPSREIARLALMYNQLDGRVRQLMTTENEARKEAKYAKGKLKEIRSVLGVERDCEILPRLLSLVQK